MLETILAPLIIGLVSGIVGAWLTLKARFDRSEAQQKEREANRKEWRKVVEKRLDSHAESLRDIADHETRLKSMEAEVAILRQRWHDLRDGTLKDAMKLFEDWKDEIVAKFQPRK